MNLATDLFVVYFGLLGLAALYGALLWSNTGPNYRPMLIFIWIMLWFQLTQTFFPKPNLIKAIFFHAEPLLEFITLGWLAKRCGIFEKRAWYFPVMLALVTALWIAQELLLHLEDTMMNSWFHVGTGLVSAILCVQIMAKEMTSPLAAPFRNARFMFSFALIIYYTLTALLEIFIVVGPDITFEMTMNMIIYYIVIGIITGIILLKSLTCIPAKTAYSL